MNESAPPLEGSGRTAHGADAAAEKRRVLRARAEALAREPQGRGESAGDLEVVEFLLASERYGVESTAVREVYPLKELTAVPCTPPFVLGVINVRGQVLAVIDVRPLFDLEARGLTDKSKVIILQGGEAGEAQFGIVADAVTGVRLLGPDELQPALPTLTGARGDYLQGVTGDRLAVLDAARILADERLVVHEEVEA